MCKQSCSVLYVRDHRFFAILPSDAWANLSWELCWCTCKLQQIYIEDKFAMKFCVLIIFISVTFLRMPPNAWRIAHTHTMWNSNPDKHYSFLLWAGQCRCASSSSLSVNNGCTYRMRRRLECGWSVKTYHFISDIPTDALGTEPNDFGRQIDNLSVKRIQQEPTDWLTNSPSQANLPNELKLNIFEWTLYNGC